MDSKKILIVEDSVIVAMELQERIRMAGYAVTGIVTNGDAAIRNTIATRPDLILMDINLRGKMNGIEAVERIRKICPVAVIYISEHSNEAIVKRAMATDPVAYMSKPFDPAALLKNIEYAFTLPLPDL
ncbi:MAG: response regulator [Methanoregula sp.]|nr:response regulator [Methanoregula sp.]